MNRYIVHWKQEAQDALAEFWLEAADRTALANAANQIDRLLGIDPIRHGVDLHEGFRALNVPPLRVIYEIHADDFTVDVVRLALLAAP